MHDDSDLSQGRGYTIATSITAPDYNDVPAFSH